MENWPAGNGVVFCLNLVVNFFSNTHTQWHTGYSFLEWFNQLENRNLLQVDRTPPYPPIFSRLADHWAKSDLVWFVPYMYDNFPLKLTFIDRISTVNQ